MCVGLPVREGWRVVCVATREGGEVCVATREEGQSVVRVATHEVLRQPEIQRGCSWTVLPARVGRCVWQPVREWCFVGAGTNEVLGQPVMR